MRYITPENPARGYVTWVYNLPWGSLTSDCLPARRLSTRTVGLLDEHDIDVLHGNLDAPL